MHVHITCVNIVILIVRSSLTLNINHKEFVHTFDLTFVIAKSVMYTSI